MNKIVREHFPVADLPETLREGLPADASVRVTLEPDGKVETPEKKRFSLEALYAQSRPTFKSLEEIADHINSIRAEWD